MADLKTAMENEFFTFEIDNLMLFGKQLVGATYENGSRIDVFQYTIGETWGNGTDFSLHHIHSWYGVVQWLDAHKGYEYYNTKYQEKLTKNKHREEDS